MSDDERLTKYDEFCARAYTDTRLLAGTRELILAMAWVMQRDPDQPAPGEVFPRVKKLLGPASRWRPDGRRSRMSELIEADAPRYEPPRQVEQAASQAFCEAPRMRAYKPRGYVPRTKPDPDLIQPTPLHPRPPTIVHVLPGYVPPPEPTKQDPCGATGHTLIVEKDPATGWQTAHWFCRRHLDQAARVAEQVREQNELAPEPIPNRGGLLGSYFKADFATLYGKHCDHWVAPVYGVCADDWPVPGVDAVPVRPRLRLLVVGGSA
ncbi:hypothetical protein [Kitasatospora sp. NBC_01302]|uniref:hypothetical protein n=1 Tax=Kitasatospora sp. NBC_01302 TaxID=2903575 RepID=UPI002E13DD04|nr:hypothetical protein OG294_14085 [Kitasatospora sp. NBC_01302]